MQDRLSGVFPMPQPISAKQYFFNAGLIDAEAALQEVQ